jgi:hypothetical protein
MITITKWSEQFETADTRKRQRLGWYLAPSGCDSKGYRLLMRGGVDGIKAFGIFNALCQLMATFGKDARGSFVNSDGSGMTMADLSEMIRVPNKEIEKAFNLLTECGWISLIPTTICQSSATSMPPACHPHATSMPENSGFVKGEGEGEEQGKEEVVLPHGEQFRTAWNDWLKFRKEIKKPMTPTTTSRQLGTLSKLPEDQAVRCLHNSMMNGWTGLFPDKVKDSPQQKTFGELEADRKDEEYQRNMRSLC